MKTAILSFAAAAALAFGGGVYAQTNTPSPTTSPTTSPSPTTTMTQPAGAPSTGFGGAQ